MVRLRSRWHTNLWILFTYVKLCIVIFFVESHGIIIHKATVNTSCSIQKDPPGNSQINVRCIIWKKKQFDAVLLPLIFFRWASTCGVLAPRELLWNHGMRRHVYWILHFTERYCCEFVEVLCRAQTWQYFSFTRWPLLSSCLY